MPNSPLSSRGPRGSSPSPLDRAHRGPLAPNAQPPAQVPQTAQPGSDPLKSQAPQGEDYGSGLSTLEETSTELAGAGLQGGELADELGGGVSYEADPAALFVGGSSQELAHEPAKDPNVALGQVRRILGEVIVSDADVSRALDAMDGLDRGGFEQVLKGLGAKQRKQLFGEMEPAHWDRFLRQGVKLGVLTEHPGKAVSGRFNPPDIPSRIADDKRLSPELRELINARNAHETLGYYKAHRSYLGRYQEAAEAAQTVSELRDLGQPLDPAPLPTKKLADGPLKKRLTRVWVQDIWHRAPTSARDRIAVSEKLDQLLGKASAGSLSLSVEIEAQVAGSGISVQASLNDATGLGGDWNAKNGLEVKLEDLNPAATTPRGTPGRSGKQPGPKVGLSQSVSMDRKGVVEKKTGLNVGQFGASISTKSNGETAIGGSVGLGDAASVGITSAVNGRKAQAGSSVSGSLDVGAGVSVSAKASLVFQGITPATVRRALDQKALGFFDLPPGLSEGVAWEALPDDIRQVYQEDLAWTQAEWNKRQARQDLALAPQMFR